MASLTSSTLYGSPMSISYQGSGSSSTPVSRTSYHLNLQVLCQQSTSDVSELRTVKVPRRSLAVATVLAVLMESYSAQEAHAAARKKTAEAPQKKPEDDKSLSAYDAKLLATYRRKEAMKEALAKQRAKSKSSGKPAAVEAAAVTKPEPETVTKVEPETPAASVAASASEAVKETVQSVSPSSE
eukprot:c3765_g1_i1 orf=194-745(+)